MGKRVHPNDKLIRPVIDGKVYGPYRGFKMIVPRLIHSGVPMEAANEWYENAKPHMDDMTDYATREVSTPAREAASAVASKPATCPHCGTTGPSLGMRRWHFNNCKSK